MDASTHEPDLLSVLEYASSCCNILIHLLFTCRDTLIHCSYCAMNSQYFSDEWHTYIAVFLYTCIRALVFTTKYEFTLALFDHVSASVSYAWLLC